MLVDARRHTTRVLVCDTYLGRGRGRGQLCEHVRPSIASRLLQRIHRNIYIETATHVLMQAVAGLRFAGLMERCWDSESTLRPSASELVDELEVYVYLYVYLHTRTAPLHLHTHTHMHTHAHTCTHTHRFMSTCIRVPSAAPMCVCVYVYIHTYIQTDTSTIY